MEMQVTYNRKKKAETEEESLENSLPDIKTYYKVIIVKIVWNWHKDGSIDQWNRIESPGLNHYVYVNRYLIRILIYSV